MNRKDYLNFLIRISPSLQNASKISNYLISTYSDEELFKIAIIDCFIAKKNDFETDYLRELYLREIKKVP